MEQPKAYKTPTGNGRTCAFPVAELSGKTYPDSRGLTKREMIAMHLHAGMLAADLDGECQAAHVAADAVRHADALLEALAEEPGPA